MFCGKKMSRQLIAKNIYKTLIGLEISDTKIGILVQLHSLKCSQKYFPLKSKAITTFRILNKCFF